jgi:hypothetical protein
MFFIYRSQKCEAGTWQTGSPLTLPPVIPFEMDDSGARRTFFFAGYFPGLPIFCKKQPTLNSGWFL